MCYYRCMTNKSTMKHARLFKLIIVTIALAVLWYCFMVLTFLGFNMLTDKVLTESYDTYNLFLIIGSIAMPFISAALTMPFAVWALKKVGVEAPVRSTIGLLMSFVFAYTLFASLSVFLYLQVGAVVGAIVSLVVAGIVYGIGVRWLKHRLSAVWFVVVAVGLALLPFGVYLLSELRVISGIN